MGVPKFFRYMSERYPCLSELVKEYQIPEFDNLYLDMNGIIHMCSHPNDFDPHFRITEERIFKDIFHYLEILFQMIKPRKLFFMAIDGVAPRAKMNQQRGRRFRSAKEAEILEKRAEAKGEKLPNEARFDSNCITPGTVFMARLHEQLKYFVTSKISCDAKWRSVKVILSGHETPGEGEHKIMEYIRWLKSRPDYDANTRHCLYGLDADLIMLGLCTHEPHFSLLREEVKFGKQSKRISSPEETKFYLLHLSLMREYLDLEFQSVKDKLNFPYDLEAIIDDWVLMGFLVGNDFIPHLPDVHIASGALPMLYNAYMQVLPTLDGYINEKGHLKLDRFQKFMEKLSAFDINQFKESYADMKYFESKTNRKMGSRDNHKLSNGADSPPEAKTGISELDALIQATNEMVLEKFFDDEEGESETQEDEDDVDIFASRVYDDDSDSEISDTFRLEFHQHKKDYYRNKLEYGKVTEKVLRDQAEGYVRAIQWNLHYYYHGVASWSWYYPHHYAPYISDICNFKDLSIELELGEPFKPFEQLLAVLPAASKSLLPAPYRELMIQESSPILEYYPPEFQTDLNGKKQDWEAVVLIPFIDEQRLLNAMIPCQEKLSEEEKKRNKFGPMLEYIFTEETLGECKAPEYFSTIKNNHAKVREIWRDDLRLDHKDIVHGLLPGIRLDVYFPGFPTFKHLPYSGELRKAKVQVFDQASRGENMVVTLLNVEKRSSYTLKEAADKYLGKNVFCAWPHLSEARVIGVADGSKRYNLLPSGKVALENLSNNLAAQCEAQKKAVGNEYMRRLGVEIGETNLIVYVNHVAGRRYVFGQEGKITLEKIYSEIQDPYAIQTVVDDIAVHDSSFVQYRTLDEVFLQGSKCFLLASPVYGSMGEVLEVKKLPEARLFIKITTNGEPDVDFVRHNQHSLKPQYMPGSKAAQHIGISAHMLSRITGTVFLVVGNKQAENPSKINIGLNLKFNKKNEEVPGFTKKDNNMWLYSRKAVALIREYIENFPEVFEHLARQTSDDVYDDKDIYPGDDCAEKVSKLSKWLKEIPSAGVERQSCGAQILDEEVVAQIEDVVKTFLENPPESKRLKLQVKPHVIYKSELRFGNMAPDPSTTYELFDRVVNVRSDSTVPLGLKGTIIGISRSENPADTMFDVLFDQEFPSAMSLAGIKGKSYRLSRISFINISHGLRQGLINDSFRNTQPHAHKNPTSAGGSTRGKEGNHQGGKWKSSASMKTHQGGPPSSKRPVDIPNKPKNFKFPAPPNVQILQKEGNPSSNTTNEHTLWNQLQMVSGTKIQSNSLPFPPPPTVLPIPNQNLKSSVDTETNVLKMMLGVTPSSPKKPEVANTSSAHPTFPGQVNVGHHKQICEITPYAHDVCGFLLQFYQRKGVGIPTYNVAAVGADAVCQLTLPDGTVVTGKAAPTKQKAAENAAMAALHLLKVCRICDTNDSSVSGPSFPPQIVSGGALVGQPQQFFEQFRQNSFRPTIAHSGTPGWPQPPAPRRALIRASFPQAPPPFPHAPASFTQPLQHHPNYHQLQQPPPNHFGQYSQSQSYLQRSPQKKQQQRPFNHSYRREDEGSNRQYMKQQTSHQLPKHDNQKAAPKDTSSFVPLQALKKQRSVKKSVAQEQAGSKAASGQTGSQEVRHFSVPEKVGKGQSSKNPIQASSEQAQPHPPPDVNIPKKKTAEEETQNESSSSRSASRMRKSRLAINFKSTPNDS